MAESFAIVRTIAPTGGGTQDITHADISGWSTKGIAIFIVNGGTIDGSNGPPSGRLSIGWCTADGRQGCFGMTGLDGRTTGGAQTSHFPTFGTDPSGRVCVIPDTVVPPSTASEGDASFSAALSNGVRINWDTTPAAAYKMTVILIAGVADAWIDANSVGASATVLCGPVGSEFRPNLVLFLGNNTTTWSGTPSRADDVSPAFGFAYDGSSLEQASIISEWNRLANPTDADMEIRTDRACGVVVAGAARHLQVTSFVSTGFVAQSDGSSISFLFLAIKWATARVCAVDIETLPSSTGNMDFIGPMFRPLLVLGAASLLTTTGSLVDGALASTFGLFAFNDTVQGAGSISHEEGLTPSVGTPTNSDDRPDAAAVLLLDHTGVLAVRATFVAMSSTGYTLNFGTATAGRILVLAIGVLALQKAVNETERSIEQVSDLKGLTRAVNETERVVEQISQSLVAGQPPSTAQFDPKGRVSRPGLIRGRVASGNVEPRG